MPDSRSHRGPHPDDPRLFADAALPGLRVATRDLSWLLGRHYAPAASLKLVGDRHGLTGRQRRALERCACSDAAVRFREARRLPSAALKGETLWLDGFNVVTTLEVALSGGVVLIARDGCARDIAGVHGSYRKVQETIPALRLLAEHLAGVGLAEARLFLDRPVSNSGRLAGIMRELADRYQWPWRVEVVDNPDRALRGSAHPVASADRQVLDACNNWYNLVRELVDTRIEDAFVVDLSR